MLFMSAPWRALRERPWLALSLFFGRLMSLCPSFLTSALGSITTPESPPAKISRNPCPLSASVSAGNGKCNSGASVSLLHGPSRTNRTGRWIMDQQSANSGSQQFSGGVLGVCLFLLAIWFFFLGGKETFLGGSGGRLLGAAPVPKIECDPPLDTFSELCRLQFSDWRWDGLFLGGKVRYNPSTVAVGPLALNRSLHGCSCYARDGSKLSDAPILGPSSLSPGETAEVKILLPNNAARIVIHMAPRFPLHER